MDAMDVTLTIKNLPSVKAAIGKPIATPQSAAISPVKSAAPVTAPVPVVQKAADTRSELDVDQTVERVISRVVDDGGSVVDQIPSESELRMLERSRQIVGAIISKTA
jgi:hypothetical protein